MIERVLLEFSHGEVLSFAVKSMSASMAVSFVGLACNLTESISMARSCGSWVSACSSRTCHSARRSGAG